VGVNPFNIPFSHIVNKLRIRLGVVIDECSLGDGSDKFSVIDEGRGIPLKPPKP